uniref:Sulfotransferase n=1 Tax=Ciona savignyi TaxID=51511 RepID=H2YZQ1_CIOSA
KDSASGEEVYFPAGCEQADLDSALRYTAKNRDVFVCSYPKTGTTWLLNMTWLVIHRGHPFPGFLRKSMPMLEFDGCEAAELIDDSEFPRCIKTHLPYNFVPKNPRAKYLYIARNPKDALVSYFFHIKGFASLYQTEDPDINKLYDLYMKGEVEFNSYFDHINIWYEHRNDPNVMFLLYEDVKQDPRKEILKIAKFLGEEYESDLKAENGKLLEKIVELSSFKHMQSANIWVSTENKRPKDLPFIRKGKTGDWKNHLTTRQASDMNQALKERCNESGACHLWDKY